MIKVLMFGWEFPPYNSGGLGVACYGLTKALSATGVEVTFVLPRETEITADFVNVKFAGVPHFQTRTVDSLLYGYITPDTYLQKLRRSVLTGQYGSNLFNEVIRYGELAGQIALETQFDLIHSHDWLSFPAGIKAKQLTGKPLIAHVHATEFDRTGGNGVNQDVYEVERAGVHAADKVIAVSNFTKHILIEKYGVHANKIEVVHNGIDLEDYELHSREFDHAFTKLHEAGNRIVLFVGRFSLQKNPDLFLRAAKKVIDLTPNTIFVMAGAGDMLPYLMELTAEMGISDKVLFPGFLRGEQLNKVYRSADLFVMPSVSEPFGIVPLEAMINGTPVIISKQSGVSEVILNALKVDFWDEDELTNKIVGALSYSPLRETMSENGAKEVQRVTWDRAAYKTIDVYQKLVNNR